MAQRQEKSNKQSKLMSIAQRSFGQLYIIDDSQENIRIGWAFLLSSQYVITDAVNVLSNNRALEHIILHIEINGNKYSRVCDAIVFPKNIQSQNQRGKQQFALLSLKQPILQYDSDLTSSYNVPFSSQEQKKQNNQTQLQDLENKLIKLINFLGKMGIKSKISQLEEKCNEYKSEIDNLNETIANLRNDLALVHEKYNEKPTENLKNITLNVSNSILTNQFHISEGLITKLKHTGKYSSLIYSSPISSKTSFQCSNFEFKGKSAIIFGVLTEDLISVPFSTSKRDEQLSIRFILDPQEDEWQIRSPNNKKISFQAASMIQQGKKLHMRLSQSNDDIIFSIANEKINISLGTLSNKKLFPFIALFEQGSSIRVKYNQ